MCLAEPAESTVSQQTGMNENGFSTLSANNSAIPQPNSANKPWRSKSLSAKHTNTSSILSVKQPMPDSSKQPQEPPKPTPNNQKSMLEKLKLFNSKGGSKTSLEGSRDTSCERLDTLPSFEEAEEMESAIRNANSTSPSSNSPKIALKGIAQRTLGRALTNKKSSPKGSEKEKDKQKEKEKNKEVAKRISVTEKPEVKEEAKEEPAPASADMPKKSSKIASFIPKGGKKEGSATSHSGIPKPGIKTATPGKSSSAPVSAKDGERSRSGKTSSGLSLQKLDNRNSSSTSSLASSEGGKGVSSTGGAQPANGPSGNTQTTGSNTVSVQLPQPQQQYNHPNTATVAPFMYR